MQKSMSSPFFAGSLFRSMGLLSCARAWLCCLGGSRLLPCEHILEHQLPFGVMLLLDLCLLPTARLLWGRTARCLARWLTSETSIRAVLGCGCCLPPWRNWGPSCLVARCWEEEGGLFLCGAQLLGLPAQLKERLCFPSSPAVVPSSLWEGSQLLEMTT